MSSSKPPCVLLTDRGFGLAQAHENERRFRPKRSDGRITSPEHLETTQRIDPLRGKLQDHLQPIVPGCDTFIPCEPDRLTLPDRQGSYVLSGHAARLKIGATSGS